MSAQGWELSCAPMTPASLAPRQPMCRGLRGPGEEGSRPEAGEGRAEGRAPRRLRAEPPAQAWWRAVGGRHPLVLGRGGGQTYLLRDPLGASPVPRAPRPLGAEKASPDTSGCLAGLVLSSPPAAEFHPPTDGPAVRGSLPRGPDGPQTGVHLGSCSAPKAGPAAAQGSPRRAVTSDLSVQSPHGDSGQALAVVAAGRSRMSTPRTGPPLQQPHRETGAPQQRRSGVGRGGRQGKEHHPPGPLPHLPPPPRGCPPQPLDPVGTQTASPKASLVQPRRAPSFLLCLPGRGTSSVPAPPRPPAALTGTPWASPSGTPPRLHECLSNEPGRVWAAGAGQIARLWGGSGSKASLAPGAGLAGQAPLGPRGAPGRVGRPLRKPGQLVTLPPGRCRVPSPCDDGEKGLLGEGGPRGRMGAALRGSCPGPQPRGPSHGAWQTRVGKPAAGPASHVRAHAL